MNHVHVCMHVCVYVCIYMSMMKAAVKEELCSCFPVGPKGFWVAAHTAHSCLLQPPLSLLIVSIFIEKIPHAPLTLSKRDEKWNKQLSIFKQRQHVLHSICLYFISFWWSCVSTAVFCYSPMVQWPHCLFSCIYNRIGVISKPDINTQRTSTLISQ